ncbi:TPA: hypothetical protein ACOECQ_000802 [Stenotrophomonas maltophilia]
MDEKTFTQLRENALALFETQPNKGKGGISLDAIFLALAAKDGDKAAAEAPTTRTTKEMPPAEWFTETLDKLKGKGEAMTISRFLMYAGRFPVKYADQRHAATWLREAGYIPRRIGGQLLFDI